MQRIAVLFSLLGVWLVTALYAQTTAPKPSPEMKKLDRFVGHFTYEGESVASALGPAGRFEGEFHIQLALKGFFVQCTGTEKDATGEMHFVEYWGYDSENKTFYSNRYEDDASNVYSEKFTMNGDTVAVTGTAFVGGRQYATRRIEHWARDWSGATMVMEFSADGKTWMPLLQQKLTKVRLTQR